ncbi:Mechanosensitive ion channel family protein [Georgfuchsia toluolica]|uniref:Mechanosensitive ion channel family protein n=1 Tax=Georgfuchsia toluolica TaxID=424218 RepID=A0A916J345_9PROT|nr:mechanosensitive ion channel domain-containing protein [Georgfuchsia toluolica]CAG4882386.1 Mechanosensitive ion channel family protein [Georgfuchsia toluolica]
MPAYDFFDWNLHPWMEAGVSALAALLVAAIVYRIGRLVLRRVAAPYVTASVVLRRAERPFEFILPLLGLQVVWNNAASDLHLIELVRHLNSLLLIVAITWLGIQGIRGAFDAVIARHPLDVADNLEARRIQTQSRVISRVLMSLVALIGLSSILMSFPYVRQVGMSLLASAGVAGLVAGMAARPVLGNLIAGLQIALSQPIRIDDVVIVENEWGRIEEITGTYVVVQLWDERRLVVPLQWFVEHPFQNWTRSDARIIGTVFLWVDYRMPLQPLRDELARICKGAPEWDGRVALLQVTETSERALQLRVLVSSADAPRNWDLRCLVREALVDYVQKHYPQHLPTLRAGVITGAPEREHDRRPPDAAGSG